MAVESANSALIFRNNYHMFNGDGKVPVVVWAKNYRFSERTRPIAHAMIVDLETGDSWQTDRNGYANFRAEPGRKLSLRFSKEEFPSVQTATVTVPETGLAGEDEEITFQVPAMRLYKALRFLTRHPNPGTHHIVTTVSAEGANLHDDRGEEGVIVSLHSECGQVYHPSFYLGEIAGKTEWPLSALVGRFSDRMPKNIIAPFKRGETSKDAAVFFRNIPLGRYVLKAKKILPDGTSVLFQEPQITVFESSPPLINISPPHGLRVLCSNSPAAGRGR